MFQEYDKVYIQRDAKLRLGITYSIKSDKLTVGRLRPTQSSLKSGKNILVGLVSTFLLKSRFYLEELELEVFNREGNLLGKIKKNIGWYKDLQLDSETGEHIATIQSNFKMNASTLTVLDPTGNKLIEAESGYGATDFSVRNAETGETLSTIKRRSLIYETARESISNHEVYHIENENLSDLDTLAVIGMAIATDIYYFY